MNTNTENKTEKEKLWSLPYILLIAFGTLNSISFYMVNPTVAKYATQIGASLTLAGVIAGLFSLTALVARPFSGFIADRVNRKLLLVGATIVMGLAAMGYSISGNIPVFVAFRILHGLAFAVSGTVSATLVATLIPRSRLSEGIGFYGLCQIFATAIGPSLGVSLGEGFGFQTTFLISGVLLIAIAFFALKIPMKSNIVPKSERKKGIRFEDLISVKVLPYAVLGGIFSMSNGIISSYLVLLGDSRGIANISIYFTVNALVLLLVRPFAGKLADKKGTGFIVYPAMAFDALALLIIGKASALWMILAAAVSKAVGQGSGQPTLQAASLKTLPPEQSGVATSTYYIGGDIGQGLGPMIGGAVSDSLGYTAMFGSAACLFGLGMVFFALFTRQQKKKKADEEVTKQDQMKVV